MLLFCAIGFAQTDDASKYAGIIRTSELQKHLHIIASDSMEGRETGTEGQRKAAAYIESFFKTTGLGAPSSLKGHQQFYPLYKDSLISSDLKIGKTTAVYGTDYISPVAINDEGKFKSKKMVFAGYGIEDKNYNDYAGLNVKGKVIVIVLGEPKKEGNYIITNSKKPSEWTNPGLAKKLALAAEKGAAGVLIINPGQDSFVQRAIDGSRKTNQYFPRVTPGKKLNFALLSHSFAKTLLGAKTASTISKSKSNAAFATADYFEQDVQTAFEIKKFRSTVMASNVLGIIEGTDKKDEYVFVTAHYDHIGISSNGQINNGADDDGSGTVAVMQMGEAFMKAKAEGKGPIPRTPTRPPTTVARPTLWVRRRAAPRNRAPRRAPARRRAPRAPVRAPSRCATRTSA